MNKKNEETTMNTNANAIINTLGREATALHEEHEEHKVAKRRKAIAENAVLKEIIDAVKPALPAISSRIAGITGGPLARAVNLGGGLHIGEHGDLFEGGPLVNGKVTMLGINDVLNRTSCSAILAVLLTAIRAQAGKLDPRTTEIEHETAILEGIAQAFQIGGVR